MKLSFKPDNVKRDNSSFSKHYFFNNFLNLIVEISIDYKNRISMIETAVF
jgi:hypothetical protein